MANGKLTDFGFEFGAARVERMFCDNKIGAVMRIETDREVCEIRVTPKGFIRLGTVTTVRPLPGTNDDGEQ